MSTEILQIDGTCHEEISKSHKVNTRNASLYLTRFYNGKEKGVNIQLTVSQSGGYGTSYIHLTKEQCQHLGKVLLDCFDYNKYPSD